MKVALDIGHLYKTSQPEDKGAIYKGISEGEIVRNYMEKTCLLLQNIENVHVYISSPERKFLVGDYYERRNWVNRFFTEKDIYIQGHLNAGGGNYGLVLCVNDLLILSEIERHYGIILKECLEKTTGIPYKDLDNTPDGITFLEPSQRGYNILKRFRCPAFIIEPMFIDNPSHFQKLTSYDWCDKIAKGIKMAIEKILNLEKEEQNARETA